MRGRFQVVPVGRALFLAGFIYFIYTLLTENKLGMYVHPRFFLFIQGTMFMLLLLLVGQLSLLFLQHREEAPHSACGCGCGHHQHLRSLWPFLLVLFLAFAFSTTNLDAKIVENKGMNTRLNMEQFSRLTAFSQQKAEAASTAEYIELDDSNFVSEITKLNLHRGDYIGKTIKVTGFVYREPQMKASQAALVRYAITCCSADAAPFGLLCENSLLYSFPDSSWITIIGTVFSENYKGKDIPVIRVTAIEPVDIVPSQQYVYP